MSKNKKKSKPEFDNEITGLFSIGTFDKELNEITELFSSGIINHKKLDNLTSEELRQISDIFK